MIDNYKNNLKDLSRLKIEQKENLFVKNINLKINMGSTLFIFVSACLFFYFFSGNLHESYVYQVKLLENDLSLILDFNFIYSFNSNLKDIWIFLSNLDNLTYLNPDFYKSEDPLVSILNHFDKTSFFMYFEDLIVSFQVLWFEIFTFIISIKFFITSAIYSRFSIKKYYPKLFEGFILSFILYFVLCFFVNTASNPVLFYSVFYLGVSVMFFNFVFSIGRFLYFKKSNKKIRNINLIDLEIENKNIEIKNNLENILKNEKLIEEIIVRMESKSLPKKEFNDYNQIMIALKKIKTEKSEKQKITNDYRKVFKSNGNDLEIENI